MEFHLTAMECHLPYGITQCYLPPDIHELGLVTKWMQPKNYGYGICVPEAY